MHSISDRHRHIGDRPVLVRSRSRLDSEAARRPTSVGAPALIRSRYVASSSLALSQLRPRPRCPLRSLSPGSIVGRAMLRHPYAPKRRPDGLPWWSSLPPRPPAPPRPRHVLTMDDRRRGGVARSAALGPTQRRLLARAAAYTRWARVDQTERERLGRLLLATRSRRVPMMQATYPPSWIKLTETMAPQPCETCGNPEAFGFRRSPLQTAVWTWRCRRHAWAGKEYALLPGYRAPAGWTPWWRTT